MKKRRIIEEELEVPFNIDIIKERLDSYHDYIEDEYDWINEYCTDLTEQELFDHRSEIIDEIHYHNYEVMEIDLQNFVEDCTYDHSNWSDWIPTKEQLIEAINKYYE